MIRITQLKVAIDDYEKIDEILRKKIIKKLQLKRPFSFSIYKKNIDARDVKSLYFVYSVDVETIEEELVMKRKIKDVNLVIASPYTLKYGHSSLENPIVVVGFGPAGIFCALQLAQQGYQPIVFERGESIEQRDFSVSRFFEEAILNEESNIQFGEGGAGTYSDGKLTARTKDVRMQKIYETLVQFGAPKDILWDSLPHVGSDLLKGVITRIRKEIIALGGSVHFNHKVESLHIENNEIVGVQVEGRFQACSALVLAIGHSSRDFVKVLHKQGVAMEAKPLAVGFRIEHKQSFIDQAMYHEFASHPALHRASYHLTSKACTKGVYSFCMCPGGMVVAATSLKERLCVNGMSNYARDEQNANSAILVQIDASDYGSELFDGLHYIDDLEKRAFQLGGSNYFAPVQTIEDFIMNKKSTALGDVKPSYPIGYTLCNLQDLFSKEQNENFKKAFMDFERKIPGFSKHAILSGVETRTSSPVRILRDKTSLECIETKGVYPCGEGAGYAGGIVSSAIDGLKVAEQIIMKYSKKGNS